MPPPASRDVRHARARVAVLARYHPADQPQVVDARRDLRAAKAEAYVRELVDGWPALSDAQRGRLAALLTGTTGSEGDGDAEAP